MKTLVLALPLAALAQAPDDLRRRRQKLKTNKIFNTLDTYLRDRAAMDLASGNISQKRRRLTAVRNEMVHFYRNVTNAMNLPDSLVHWYQEVSSAKSRAQCGVNRSIAECTTFIPFDAIWDYACFCQFGDDAGTGQGTVQNEMDGACKKLNSCYKCAKIDSLSEAEICKPGDTDYKVDVNKAFFQGVYATCQENNPDQCAVNVCTCEVKFIKDVLALFFSSYQFDPSLHHDIWTKHKEVCLAQSNGPSVLECCGSYPDRTPYNVNGATECCNNEHLYNSNNLQCCPGGKVKASC